MPAAAEVIHQRMPARKQVGSFFSCPGPSGAYPLRLRRR